MQFTAGAQRKSTVENSYTLAKERMSAWEKHKSKSDQSLLKGIEFRSVGPSVMSGRVVDIEVDPNDETHFFVAYATGGLWETRNNGTTFTPLFDKEWIFGIGDIAIDWKSDVIYVGTGENNSSRSSYAGIGLFRSSDHGKNWEHLGLEETHHIGRVILHPTDANTIWVSSIGHLFTPNKERGLYKSSDGGKTWNQTLFVNENTGVIDLIVDEKNPSVLYAATWHRERRAWNFIESGSGSGIYKSTNGGDSWQRISTPESGFPQGDGVGRIGIALCKNKPEIVYAFLDNQALRKDFKKESDPDALSKDQLKKMSKEEFLSLDEKKINRFLQENNFPKKITIELVRTKILDNSISPKTLAEYLEDANALLFDTPVTGAEFYRSNDGGKTWKKTHDTYVEDLVFTYGYYFGQISVDENDPEKIYASAFVVIKSEDGGKTFESINGDNVHVDHHALYVNPKRKGHLINGNDGGVNISYDNGTSWIRCNTPAVGQFYTINVDMASPYNIYGGLQDNGVWYGSSQHKESFSWQMEGEYPWKTILGGDGMQVMIDPRDNSTVYTGYQFGHYYRINKNTGESFYITPKHELGERPLRWNWQTPIWLSTHSADVIYMGANKVFRSLKQGEEFVAISGDLTKGGKPGDVAYGTITALHESPLKFGLLYAGTDDGFVWVTKDGGNSWNNITGTLPADFTVRRVHASRFVEGRVYVCLNGHTRDDFSTMVFSSEDYGKTWSRIATDISGEAVNVIREDPANENLIYVGTDHGLYASLDKGKSFQLLNTNLPNVPVHDLVIHPRDKELVVGTHGRSVYVANIAPLQELTTVVQSQSLYLYTPNEITHSRMWGKSWSRWEKGYEPEIAIYFWTTTEGSANIELRDASGKLIFAYTTQHQKGLSRFMYNLKNNQEKTESGKYEYLKPGDYKLSVSSGASTSTTTLKITEKR